MFMRIFKNSSADILFKKKNVGLLESKDVSCRKANRKTKKGECQNFSIIHFDYVVTQPQQKPLPFPLPKCQVLAPQSSSLEACQAPSAISARHHHPKSNPSHLQNIHRAIHVICQKLTKPREIDFQYIH